MGILGWIFVIYLVIMIPAGIVFNTARIIYGIRCFKVKKCSDRTCRFKKFCRVYEKAFTEDEVRELQRMIGKL
ncbi:MAG: hypothetical protein NC548_25325 [Lachnospiraceae bacterium]|nr:hypothetical protein [Lachnospiraceae bacterium]